MKVSCGSNETIPSDKLHRHVKEDGLHYEDPNQYIFPEDYFRSKTNNQYHHYNSSSRATFHSYEKEEEGEEEVGNRIAISMNTPGVIGSRNINENEYSYHYYEIEGSEHDATEERKGDFSGLEAHLHVGYPASNLTRREKFNNDTEANHSYTEEIEMGGEQQRQINNITVGANNSCYIQSNSYDHDSSVRNFSTNIDHQQHQHDYQQQQQQNSSNLPANTINQIVTMESVPFTPLPIPLAYRSYGSVYIDGAVKKLQLITMQQTGQTYCMIKNLVFEKARVMIIQAGRVKNNVYPTDPHLYVLDKVVVIKRTSLRQLIQSREQNSGILIENPYDEIFAMVHIGTENDMEMAQEEIQHCCSCEHNYKLHHNHLNHHNSHHNRCACQYNHPGETPDICSKNSASYQRLNHLSCYNDKNCHQVKVNSGNSDSDHICKILDYAQDEDFLYTVLPFLPNKDLYHLMKTRNKPLPESVAKDYFRQTLYGLRELKRKNICHRDLSLENLMFDREGKIKIIDFGMCLQIPTYQVTHVIPYAIDMEGSEKVYAEQMALMINDGKSVANGGLLIASPTETEVNLFSPMNGCSTFDSIERQHEKDEDYFYPPQSHEGPSTKDSLNDMNCNQSMFGPESKDAFGEDISWVVVHREEKLQDKENIENEATAITQVEEKMEQHNQGGQLMEDLDTLVDGTYSSSEYHNNQSHQSKKKNGEEIVNEQSLHEQQPTPLTIVYQRDMESVNRNQSQTDRTATNSVYGRPNGLVRTPSLLSSIGGTSPVTEYMRKNRLGESKDSRKESQFQSAIEDQNKVRQVQQFRTIIETKHAWCRAEAKRGKANYISPEIANETPFDGFAVDMWSVGIILYIMLTVTPLYSSANDKAFEFILNGELNRLLDHYETWGLILSPLARDLVLKLLEVDPRKRITLEEALEHPWLVCDRDKARDQVSHDKSNGTILREESSRVVSRHDCHYQNRAHHQNLSSCDHLRHNNNSNLIHRGHPSMASQQRADRCNIGG